MQLAQLLSLATGHWREVVFGSGLLVSGTTAVVLRRASKKKRQSANVESTGSQARPPIPTGKLNRMHGLLTGSLMAIDALPNHDPRRLVLEVGQRLAELGDRASCDALALDIKAALTRLVSSSFDSDGTPRSTEHARRAVRMVQLFVNRDDIDLQRETAASVTAVLLAGHQGAEPQSAPVLGGHLRQVLLELIRSMNNAHLFKDPASTVDTFLREAEDVLRTVVSDYNQQRIGVRPQVQPTRPTPQAPPAPTINVAHPKFDPTFEEPLPTVADYYNDLRPMRIEHLLTGGDHPVPGVNVNHGNHGNHGGPGGMNRKQRRAAEADALKRQASLRARSAK